MSDKIRRAARNIINITHPGGFNCTGFGRPFGSCSFKNPCKFCVLKKTVYYEKEIGKISKVIQSTIDSALRERSHNIADFINDTFGKADHPMGHCYGCGQTGMTLFVTKGVWFCERCLPNKGLTDEDS